MINEKLDQRPQDLQTGQDFVNIPEWPSENLEPNQTSLEGPETAVPIQPDMA